MKGLQSYRVEETRQADGLVSTARAVGPSGECRLRVFEVPGGLGIRPDLAVDLWRFLESGSLQREVAKGSPFWIPVQAMAREGGVAFIATDSVAETLQGLVDRKAHLRADELERIVRDILAALRAYHLRWGRASGALRLSTVVLNSPADAGSGVRLTDPMCLPADRGRIEKIDVPALGQLIFRIVEGHDERFPVHPPIRTSAAWSRLGRSGSAWLELTNRMLDPRAAERGELPSLDEIEGALPKEPFNWRKPAGVAASLVAVASVSFLLWMNFIYNPRLSDNQIKPMKDGLVFLCEEYPSWFQSLRDEWVIAEPSPLEQFQGDEWLSDSLAQFESEIITPIKDAEKIRTSEVGTIFNPATYWLDASGKPERFNVVRLRDEIEGATNDDFKARFGQKTDYPQVEAAKETVLAVRSALSENWILGGSMRAMADRFTGRGWVEAGGELRATLEMGEEPKPSSMYVLKAFTLAQTAGRLDARWEEIDRVDASEGQSGFPSGPSGRALASFDERVSEMLASVEGVSGGAVFLEQSSAVIDEMIWAGGGGVLAVHWKALEDDGGQTRADWSAAQLSDFAGWVSAARKYERLEKDPRELGLWDQLADQVQQRIDGMIEYEAPEEAAPIEKRLSVLLESISELDRTPVVKKNEEMLGQRSGELTSQMRVLADDAETTYARVVVPADVYLVEVTAERMWLPSAQVLWDDQIRNAGTVAQLLNDPLRDKEFRKVMRALRDTLDWLRDDGFGVTQPPNEIRIGFDASAFILVAEARRDVANERAIIGLQGLIDQKIRPHRDEAEVSAMIGVISTDLADWAEGAVGLADEYLQLAALLDDGSLIDTEGDSESVEQRDMLARQRPSYAELQDAVDGVQGRIQMVQELESLGTVTELADVVATNDLVRYPELLCAAWRRLSDPSGVSIESSPIGLELARDLIETTMLWTADSDSRLDGNPKATFAALVDEDSHRVWSRVTSAAVLAEEMRAVVHARGEFGVIDDSLSASMRWNIELTDLTDALGSMADPGNDESAQGLVLGFLGQADSLGVGVSEGIADPAGIEGLLEISRSVTSDEEEIVDYNEIGPARLKGFNQKPAFIFNPDRSELPDVSVGGPPTRLVYDYVKQTRSDSDYSIEFLLANPESTSPVLLSRTEVSVQLFFSAMKLDGMRDEIVSCFNSPPSSQAGPRVWNYSTGSGTVFEHKKWLVVDQPGRVDYPAGLDGGRPQIRHPMQYVSPKAALYIAGVLGCRFPTSEEYRAAVKLRYGVTDESELLRRITDTQVSIDRRITANLRDKTWEKQRVHSIAEVDRMNTLMSFSPSQGAFRENQDQNSKFETDDGVLWFYFVGESTGGEFEGLLGNVCEWVSDDPAVWERDPGAAVPMPDDLENDLKALIRKNKSLGVAGGSAISPPAAGIAGIRAPTLTELDNKPVGFADVGFRLALVPKGRFVPISEYVLGFADSAFVLGDGD